MARRGLVFVILFTQNILVEGLLCDRPRGREGVSEQMSGWKVVPALGPLEVVGVRPLHLGWGEPPGRAGGVGAPAMPRVCVGDFSRRTLGIYLG